MRLFMILVTALCCTAGCASNSVEEVFDIEAGKEVEFVARASRASISNLGPGELSVAVATSIEDKSYAAPTRLAQGERWRGSARGVSILVVNVSVITARVRAYVSGAHEGRVQLVAITREGDDEGGLGDL